MENQTPTSFFKIIRERLDEKYLEIRNRGKENDEKQIDEAAARKAFDETFAQTLFHRSFDNIFSKRNGFSRKLKQYSPVLLEYFYKVAFSLNLHPEKFLLDQEDEDVWFKENKKTAKHRSKYFTREYWEKAKLYWPEETIWDDFDIFNHHNPKRNEELKIAYRKAAPFLMSAEKQIIIHELLFKGDFNDSGAFPVHNEAQDETHNAILYALRKHSTAKTDFKYRRAFFLSASSRLFIKDHKSEWLKAFVTEAHLSTLIHIIGCLKKYKSYCSFIVFGDRHSLRHKVIIDDNDLMIEDYKYKDGTTTPESLCRIKLKGKKEKSTILDFINSAFPERYAVEIKTVENIEDALKAAIKHCEQEARSRKELREFLNRDAIKGQLNEMNKDKIGKKRLPPNLSKLVDRIESTEKIYADQSYWLSKKMRHLRIKNYLT